PRSPPTRDLAARPPASASAGSRSGGSEPTGSSRSPAATSTAPPTRTNWTGEAPFATTRRPRASPRRRRDEGSDDGGGTARSRAGGGLGDPRTHADAGAAGAAARQHGADRAVRVLAGGPARWTSSSRTPRL